MCVCTLTGTLELYDTLLAHQKFPFLKKYAERESEATVADPDVGALGAWIYRQYVG